MDKRSKAFKQGLEKSGLTIKEYDYLTDLFSRLKGKIEKQDTKECLVIYRRLIYPKQKSTMCAPCWRKIIAALRKLTEFGKE